MRLLSASLLKLVHRPASIRMLSVLAVLLVLVFAGLAAAARTASSDPELGGIEDILRFPDALRRVASMLSTFAGIAAAAYARHDRGLRVELGGRSGSPSREGSLEPGT